MYRIKTASRRVEKEIADLRRYARDRVIEAIRSPTEEARPRGARKLTGEMAGAWRIRVGDYRVIYDVDDEQPVIVLAVLHRREAYRRR